MLNLTNALLLSAFISFSAYAAKMTCEEINHEQVTSPVESDSEIFLHNLDRNVLKLLAYTGIQEEDKTIQKFATEVCLLRLKDVEEEIQHRAQVGGVNPENVKAQVRIGTLSRYSCSTPKVINPLCYIDIALFNEAKFKISELRFDGFQSKRDCYHSMAALEHMLTAVVVKKCIPLTDGVFVLRTISIVKQ